MVVYDLLTEFEKTLNLKTMNGNLTSSRISSYNKKGLRKFQNGKIYSFNYFGNIDNDNFIKKSDINSTEGVQYKYDINLYKNFIFESEVNRKMTHEEYQEYALACEKILKEYSSDFSFIGTYHFQNTNITLKNSEGFTLIRDYNYLYNWYRFTAKGSSTIMDGYLWFDDQHLNLEKTSEMFHKTLSSYFKKSNIENGEYPVLFTQSNEAEGSFLEKLKYSLKADNYFEKSGILTDSLGKKIFNSQFSMIDNSIYERQAVFNPFDGEGYIRQEAQLKLIENGVVKNVVTDLRSANKYNIAQTGNSVRSYKSASITDYNHIQILQGTRSTDEILKSLPFCIVVHMSGGGDFNDLGDYSQPTEFSYLYQYGQVVGRLPSVTLSSNMFKMFGDDLIEIANDNFYKSAASPSVFMKMKLLVN